MCCALALQNVGVFRFTDRTGFTEYEGIVSGVMTQARKRIRTEY